MSSYTASYFRYFFVFIVLKLIKLFFLLFKLFICLKICNEIFQKMALFLNVFKNNLTMILL